MMPTCKEVSRLLASGELETAPAARRIFTRLHLLMCDDCSRYAKELRQLGEAARQALGSPLDPSRLASLERAILARLAGTDPSEAEADPD